MIWRACVPSSARPTPAPDPVGRGGPVHEPVGRVREERSCRIVVLTQSLDLESASEGNS